MKKILIGLAGMFLVAFIFILVSKAQNNTQEVKKAETEMSKDCSKCPSASACGKMSGSEKCDPAKCKEMGCDPAKCKEGKCDHSKCKRSCTNADGETKKCIHAPCTVSSNK